MQQIMFNGKANFRIMNVNERGQKDMPKENLSDNEEESMMFDNSPNNIGENGDEDFKGY